MAATRIIEEERGSYLGTPRNPHQGYYAGDFSRRPSEPNGFARAARYAGHSSTSTASSSWT